PSLVNGDSFTGTLTRASGENIGNYGITQGTLSAGNNYSITYVAKDFAITAKPITVTADASQTKVYGTVDPTFTYSVSPSLVSGDSFTGTLTRDAGENIGNYTITQGTLSAGNNYSITYVSKDLAITAKLITVTADASQTKVYGTVDPTFTYSVSPSLVSGDAFTGTLTRDAGENIGNYTITQGTLSAGNNYSITYVAKDFVITAKPITVTADASQTKVYGTVDPTFTYSVSPALVSGDSFTGTLTRASGENIGNYTITQGTLSAGNNYSITYVA
ncbi:MBG domain-containing protein, partial [Flavobacterium sp. ST-87]